MKPPQNAKIYNWETSDSWFDEDGIFCSVQKKTRPQTLEETIEAVEIFKELLEGKKACLLVDATNSAESLKESRDYAAGEFPKIIKAMAIVSRSALGRMLANLFFSLKKQPYPVRMFGNEKEAKVWLRQYLE